MSEAWSKKWGEPGSPLAPNTCTARARTAGPNSGRPPAPRAGREPSAPRPPTRRASPPAGPPSTMPASPPPFRRPAAAPSESNRGPFYPPGPRSNPLYAPVADNRGLMRFTGFVLASVLGLCVTAVRFARPADWPQFRGTGGAGIADASTLPTRWSPTENVAWVTEVPGRGWSSPVVWRDRVFVTSAVNSGRFKAGSTGIYGNDYAEELSKQGL